MMLQEVPVGIPGITVSAPAFTGAFVQSVAVPHLYWIG